MSTKIMLLAVGLGVGGTETHVLELASRIDRNRFEVMVCSLKADGCLAAELRQRGVRVVSLGGEGKLDFRVLFRLWRLLQKERPDVVQAFLFWANLVARLMGRVLKRIRVISSYHDEIVAEGVFIRAIDRLTTRWTDVVVCCSEAVRRSVAECIGDAGVLYVTIPFGIDATQFEHCGAGTKTELGLRADVPTIGTICRLVEPKKGLQVLLSAMGLLKAQASSPGCQLLIVGDGPARPMLEAMSRRLDIAPWVVFAGTRRDVPRLLPLLDAFVLPSLYEGFGIALLEAMAAGRPVVATTVGGIPEFVTHGETGILVEPGNAAALAHAIQTMLANPEQARQMGLRGQRHVQEKFEIATVVRQHEQVYEACLAHAWSGHGANP